MKQPLKCQPVRAPGSAGRTALAVAAFCLPPPAHAEHAHHEHHAHGEVEEVLVIGHPLSGEGFAQISDVLDSEDLKRKAAHNIGATIGNEPGVHNASFGAAIGRPVIRGLGGARVRIMEDRIDTLDVSVTGADHVVGVDAFIAEGIEITKGSGTLMYGSGAIGGVVDVHTGRIPHGLPERVSGRLDVRASDNGDGRNGSFRLDGGGGNFAWHVDGFSREADDYDIPGFAESALLRRLEETEEEHHDEDEHGADEDDHAGDEDNHEDEDGDDHADEEEIRDRLPGSGLDFRGGSGGFSLIGERGFVGVSVGLLDGEYGIPGHDHDSQDHEEEVHHDDDEDDHVGEDVHEDDHLDAAEGLPFVDIEQTRVDFEAALSDPLPGFESLNLRVGVNDYEHQEIEGSGAIGTALENDAWEARLELTHGLARGWHGALGVQFGDRSFTAVGEEAFTPPVDTRSLGVFWVGDRDIGSLELEAGVRLDRVEHEPPSGTGARDFTGASASVGLVAPLNFTWEATLLLDYSTRAPVGEELYSAGSHLATQSFEVGNPDLDEERALNLSASLGGGTDRWSVLASVFYTDFADFIHLVATGEERGEVAVRRFSQSDTTFAGLELEATWTFADFLAGELEIGAFFDTVSAKLDVSGNDQLHHMPPDRVGFFVKFSAASLTANLDFVHAFEQADTGDFELPSDAYDDLRARVGWEIERGAVTFELYLQGRNLTDDEQRKHTSIVKDLVPEPGRTLEGGVRLRF